MYPVHRGAHSPKAGNAGSDAKEDGESPPEAIRLPHAQGSLALGFFSFLWVGKFTTKNRSFNPRFHPTMQDISWSKEGMHYISRKRTKWAEVPPLLLGVHTNARVQWQQWRPIWGAAAVQPLGTTLPLQGWGTTHSQCSSLDLPTPDRAMWPQCSQIQYSQFANWCCQHCCQGRPPFRHCSEAGHMEKLSIRDTHQSPPDSRIRHQNHGCCPVTYTHLYVPMPN